MKKNTVIEIITILFMALFFYTAINKLMVIPTLTSVLSQYPILGAYPKMAAWTIPIFEITIVGLLYFKRNVGLWVSMITMACFSVYVSYMLLFHPKLPCTCGGLIQQLNWPQHLLLNIILFLLALISIVLTKQQQKHSLYHLSNL